MLLTKKIRSLPKKKKKVTYNVGHQYELIIFIPPARCIEIANSPSAVKLQLKFKNKLHPTKKQKKNKSFYSVMNFVYTLGPT